MIGLPSRLRGERAAALAQAIHHDGLAPVVVHDGDAEDAARYRDLVGAAAIVIDRGQRLSLASRVAEVCGLDPVVTTELLAPEPASWTPVTTGGARNTLRLLALVAGDRWSIQVDDDVRWPPVALRPADFPALATFAALPHLGAARPVRVERLLASPAVGGADLVAAGVVGSPVGDQQDWRTWAALSSDAPAMVAWSPGAPRSLSPIGLVGTCFAVRADRPLPPFLPWGRGQDGLFGYLLGRLGGVEMKVGWVVRHDRPTEHPIRLTRGGAGDLTEAIAILASQCPPTRRSTLTELASWLADLARRGPTRLDALLREAWRRRCSHQLERLDALVAGPPRDLLRAALSAAEGDAASHRPRELRVLTDGPGVFADVLARHARHCEVWAAVVAAKEALAGIDEIVTRGRPWT